ncbi:hypothetical protein EXIGLDRAFT_419043 [Exidia glandulosa HHB12029]|uniref:Uncharacterized protein n=1 Tax=Exidia glandulosa HHB12029 TaxID=1314781 RepID=A0A165PUD7_EXIGL|nr:hypothetical protein EXIGLDRAFT_419043 [Exidia glandulosa HHB12029]
MCLSPTPVALTADAQLQPVMKLTALFSALLAATVCCGSALPALTPPETKDIIVYGTEAHNTTMSNSTSLAAIDIDEHKIQKRGLLKLVIGLGLSLLGGVPLQTAMGLGELAEKGWAAAVQCQALGPFTFGCLDGVIDTAMFAWDNNFFVNNGIAQRDVVVMRRADGSVQYSYSFRHPRLGAHVSVVHTQHLPVGNHTTVGAMLMARPNAGTWAHAYTREYNGTHRVTAMHRRINVVTEEGDDSGTLHQLRATHYAISSESKRVEFGDAGVVLDYIWNDGSQTAWNMDRQAEESNFAAVAASTMYNQFTNGGANNVMASCCTMGQLPTHSEGDPELEFKKENEGVMAFGTGNQPFSESEELMREPLLTSCRFRRSNGSLGVRMWLVLRQSHVTIPVPKRTPVCPSLARPIGELYVAVSASEC